MNKGEGRLNKLFSVGTKIICITAILPMALYAIWLLCRAVLLDQFVIPTNSMQPTLIPGDRVIVDKTIFMHSRTLRLTTILKKL